MGESEHLRNVRQHGLIISLFEREIQGKKRMRAQVSPHSGQGQSGLCCPQLQQDVPAASEEARIRLS